jgi:hypothetical protein
MVDHMTGNLIILILLGAVSAVFVAWTLFDAARDFQSRSPQSPAGARRAPIPRTRRARRQRRAMR